MAASTSRAAILATVIAGRYAGLSPDDALALALTPRARVRQAQVLEVMGRVLVPRLGRLAPYANPAAVLALTDAALLFDED